MADYTQAAVELLAHQEITHPGSVVGAAADVRTYLGGMIYIYQANIETTANVATGGDSIAIEISPDDSGPNWAVYTQVAPNTTQSTDTAFDGNEAQGQTTLSVATTSGKTAGTIIYIKDATSVATSEWNEVASFVTDDTITVTDGILVAKESVNDHVFSNAARWAFGIDLAGVSRLRIVVHHQGSAGSDWRVYANALFATDME